VIFDRTSHPNAQIFPTHYHTTENGDVLVYDLQQETDLFTPHIKVGVTHAIHNDNSLFDVQNFVVGVGDDKGTFVTVFTNHNNVSLSVRYCELIPWYVRVYLHTLQFTFSTTHHSKESRTLTPLHAHYISTKQTENEMIHSQFDIVNHPNHDLHSVPSTPPPSSSSQGNHGDLSWVRLVPAKDRIRPAVVEYFLTLPPSTTLQVVAEYDLALLYFFEYPPDAHRGYDVGAAAVSYHFDYDNSHTTQTTQLTGLEWPNCFKQNKDYEKCIHKPHKSYRRYTNMVRISLPTPDFSMPYNVIVFSCTVISLFFGQMLSLILMRLRPLREGKEIESTRLGFQFFQLIRTTFKRKKE
jgi:hypothetical protein